MESARSNRRLALRWSYGKVRKGITSFRGCNEILYFFIRRVWHGRNNHQWQTDHPPAQTVFV